MKHLTLISILATAATLMTSSQAFAWGEQAHKIVATVGATLTTNGQSFFQANATNFANLTTVPDVDWKSSNRTGESPNHWFQADHYFPSLSINDIETFPKSYATAVSQYTEPTVIKEGTATWRVKQFYDLAVQALKSGDPATAMEYMGVMSHYIGDMSQPLHDSVNYDGPNGASNGIHYFFESQNITNTSQIQTVVQQRAQALLADASFTAQFTGDIMDVLYHEVARALAYRDQIFNTDSSMGRTGAGQAAQLDLAESRMADGAATLALILDHLWADAGISSSSGAVSVSTPSWVAPDFTDLTPWKLIRYTPIDGPIGDDDCSR